MLNWNLLVCRRSENVDETDPVWGATLTRQLDSPSRPEDVESAAQSQGHSQGTEAVNSGSSGNEIDQSPRLLDRRLRTRQGIWLAPQAIHAGGGHPVVQSPRAAARH